MGLKENAFRTASGSLASSKEMAAWARPKGLLVSPLPSAASEFEVVDWKDIWTNFRVSTVCNLAEVVNGGAKCIGSTSSFMVHGSAMMS